MLLSNFVSAAYFDVACWRLTNGTTCFNGTSGILTGIKLNWSDILNNPGGSSDNNNYTSGISFGGNRLSLTRFGMTTLTADISNNVITLDAGKNLTNYNGLNNTHFLHCSNITNAVSNLCTLIDTDTNTGTSNAHQHDFSNITSAPWWTIIDAQMQNTSTWASINAKALPGACSSGQFVNQTTTSGVLCQTPTSVGDGTGGWTNTTTETKTDLIANASKIYTSNLTFRNSTNSPTVYVYVEDATSTTLRIYGLLYTNSHFTSGGNLASSNDIYSTGAGDDLWLGTSTQESALFKAYANGNLNATGSITLPILGQANCDVKAYNPNGTLYCGTDATGEGGTNYSILVDQTRNITGTTSTSVCGGTDKVKNITINNGVISATCETDQTGTATSNEWTNFTKTIYNVSSSVVGVEVTEFTTNLDANTNYTIYCTLIGVGNLTGTAMRMTANISGTVNRVLQTCETGTSATARFNAGSQTTNFNCATTATIGTLIPTPIYYNGIIQENGADGTFKIFVYNEIAATNYNQLEKYSWCKYTKN